MSAPIDVDHHITDHLCRWSRTGCDGACLDRCRIERRATLKSPPGINPVIAIGLGSPIVPASRLDQCQLRRRSAPAVPATTTKSP